MCPKTLHVNSKQQLKAIMTLKMNSDVYVSTVISHNIYIFYTNYVLIGFVFQYCN